MNNLLMILKLLPAIIEAIKAMEAALPADTPGKVKLQTVLDITTQVESSMTALVPQLTSTISILVDVFRATGVMKAKEVA